jgi:acyl carrier protein
MGSEVSREEVLTRLQGVFDNVFLEPIRINPALSAKDVEEWDSLVHISLVVAVEKEFRVRFRVGEVESTKNVGEFVELIVKRIGDSKAA